MKSKKKTIAEPVAQQEQPKQKAPAVQYHQGPNGQLYRMSFGMPVPPGTEDCMTAAWAFVHYEEAMERGCSTPRAELFWWIVDFFWGEGARKRFIRHPWAEKMTLYACEHNYLGVSGSASCVIGSTRILNPLTGETPTIKELCDSGTPPVVMTTEGPALATVPFLKGHEELFRVELRNGTSFVSTASHRVLTEHGFVPVSSLRCGQSISGYDPALFQSISDTDSSTLQQDALSLPKRAEDSQGSCCTCSCPCDEQLPPVADTCQEYFPSPAGAQEHTGCVCEHMGGLGSTEAGIRPCPQSPRLSSVGFSPLCSPKQKTHDQPHGPARIALLGRDLTQLRKPFSQETCPPRTSSKADLYSCRKWTVDLLETWKNQTFLRGFLKSLLQYLPQSRQLELSEQCRNHLGTSSIEDLCSERICHSCLPNLLGVQTYTGTLVEPVAVSRITSVGYHDFYDLQVPGPNHYFAEGAIHHNSGKSDWGAVWGLVNWWCDPVNTKVLITSTTMKDAQKRIWGSVRDYYYGGKHKMPGKYVHSFGQIRTSEKASDNTASDKSGLELIPCSQSKEAQAIGRLIGMKAPRMIIVADELPELTDSILEAVETNLSANPSFQMIGLGNHVSWLDPFGKFVTPKNGINSVTVEDEDWETSRGWCVHFDGTKSPNFESERDIYPIYGRKQKREHDKLPTTSIGFWRFCRSFPPADSEAGQIYSEIEIISNGGVTKPHYKGPLVRLAALDPAFTTGGDRAYGIQGTLGETIDGRMVLAVTLHKPFYEDVTDKEVPRNYQIARQFAQWCKENGIQPEDTGVDSTGAGIPFAEILMQEWSPRIQRIAFGGAASSLPASATDPTPGNEAYANRVSQLWYQGIYYIRSSQLGDIPRNIVKEMCCRRYIHVKGATTRIKVESKEEMKKRLKESPDASDAFFILLEVARVRHQFFPEAFGAALKEQIAKEEESADSSNVLEDFACLLTDDEGS